MAVVRRQHNKFIENAAFSDGKRVTIDSRSSRCRVPPPVPSTSCRYRSGLVQGPAATIPQMAHSNNKTALGKPLLKESGSKSFIYKGFKTTVEKSSKTEHENLMKSKSTAVKMYAFEEDETAHPSRQGLASPTSSTLCLPTGSPNSPLNHRRSLQRRVSTKLPRSTMAYHLYALLFDVLGGFWAEKKAFEHGFNGDRKKCRAEEHLFPGHNQGYNRGGETNSAMIVATIAARRQYAEKALPRKIEYK
nr:hypothetical protein Iba_chr14cCG3880 [Ipomoea batatas]